MHYTQIKQFMLLFEVQLSVAKYLCKNAHPEAKEIFHTLNLVPHGMSFPLVPIWRGVV